MRTARRDWPHIDVSPVACGCLAFVLGVAGCTKGGNSTEAPTAKTAAATAAAATPDRVELNATQVKALRLATIGTQRFTLQSSAVGSIDFNENTAVQVYSPYPGRIIQAFADVGDEVKRGNTLYTIDSPDLLQAESTLIGDAAQADLTAAALARAKDLYEHEGMAQKDYQQAISDQMTAEAALKSARDAVRIFGKNDTDIDAMIAKRKVDSTLVIPSPVSGRIAARFAQPGLLVQPGNPPAPYQVADLSTMWMLASVPENDVAQLKLGQPVTVTVAALGNVDFKGTIKTIGETIDPSTHTAVVRSVVEDPQHQLRPGMMATFVIETGAPAESVAIPVKGVVREGDGTMSVWVTTDRRQFLRHTVSIGLQQDQMDQILTGLRAGELAVVDGAIFLSNIAAGGSGGD
jgi:cobalt-zinc-cadmium efflux system membrane fusion protein